MSSLLSRFGSIHRSVGKFVVLAFSLLVFAIALTGSASADLDTFTTGDGHEGAVTVSTNSVLNYSAPLNAAASAGATSLTTGTGQTGAVGTATTTGSAAQTQFEANRLALVIQSSNYSGPGATSGSQADIDLSTSATGQWELAKISSVTGSIAAGMTVNFVNPLVNSYASTGAQIVAIPEFTTVQVNSSRAWSANPWNGTNGGITGFLANGTVNLTNTASSINADGDGFRGGLTYNGSATACTQLDGTVGGGKGEGIVSGIYPGSATSYASRGNVANGGGGGVCENSGGGGGGNGGQGGIGGASYDGSRNVGGLGGTKLNYSAFDRAIFGGGGGAGDENNDNGGEGGDGGGLVFVRANALTGSGVLSANGAAGANSAAIGSSDGAGGGGAGGVVYARFNTTAACNLASVRGGAGGNEQSTGGVHGPGGGGAGGRLVLQSSGGTCPTNVGNGTGGITTVGNNNRGSGPTSSTDATSSGATEAVSGGGGLSAPTATVSTPANGAYVNSATPTISGTSSMTLGTIRVTIDGAYVGSVTTAANGDWSYTPGSALTAGSHTYTVRPVYYGIAGAATGSRTLIVDTVAPTVAISGLTSPTASGASQTATITRSDNVAVTSQTCQLDAGAATACTTSYATGALSAGSHTITVIANDAAGNSTTQTATIIVDQTAPTVAISGQSTPTASTASQSLTITAADNVALATVTCRVDSGANTSCIGGTYATGALTAGSHTITVIATDTVGNATTQTATIVVDQTAPTVTVSGLTSPTNSTASQTATITAADNVALATVTCRVDSGATTSCIGGTYATGTLAAGSHTITVIATDTSGNQTTQTATVVVDTTAPTLAISGQTTPTASSTSQNLTITSADNVALATVTCRVDSGATTSCIGGSYATGTLAAGSHTITAIATDTAGNSTTQTATIVIDQTPPSVAISGLTSPTASGASQTATITRSDNIAIATQTCRLDSGATTACTTSYATGALSNGSHTITVIATDTSGNATTQTATIVVDQTAPTVSIGGQTSPTSSTASQSLTITAADNLALTTVTCRVDSGATTSCIGGTYATGTLTAGSHTVTVIASDSVGNTTTQTATIVVDQTSPTVTISGQTTPTSSGASQTLTIATSDNVALSTVTCRVDSGATTSCIGGTYATGALAAGSHTITVIATDTVGNATTQTATIVVDQTAPAVTISGVTSPTRFTTSQTATIAASDNVAIASQTCRLNSGTPAACTTSFATGVLTVGTNTITVVAADTSGNVTTQTATIFVDQTAPSVAISGLTSPTNSTASQTATIAASDNVAIASQTCRLDSGANTACTTSYATGVMTAGTHTITVVATDTAGNVTTQTATIVVDTTVPTLSISGLTTPTNSTASQTATITAGDNLALSTVTCRVDSGATTSCIGGTYATGTLSAGTHTLTAIATDTAGNQTTQTATIVVDQTNPTLSISGLTSPTSSSSSQTATITAADNVALSTVTCRVDSGATTSCIGGTYATGTLTAGSHTITVIATDTSGNQTTQTATIVVDQTAPNVAISGLTTPTNSTASQTATITASDNVALASQTCRLDSGANTACTTSFATGALTAGTHTITVIATDTVGNSTTQTATIVVDQTLPTVAISGLTSPTNSGAGQTATITTTDNVAIASQTCRLDSGANTACTTSFATGALSAGTHTITVIATDTAGNQRTQTATIVVDQTAPSLAISGLTSPTNSTSSQTATITASDNIALSTVTCRVDSGATTSCIGGSYATGTLTAGSHTITVIATDTSGNQTTQTATVVVDTSSPVVTITPPTSPTASSASQNIAFTATDNGTITLVECRIDSGSFAPCTSPFATGTLTAGSHSVYVRATDNAANQTTQSVTIVVDQTGPAVTISGLISPRNSTASQTATIGATDNVAIATVTCSIDGGASTSCIGGSYATGTLAAGSHTVSVTATDTSGNATTQTATIVIDLTAPSVAITGLTSPTRFTTSQTAAITTTDNVAIASQTCRLNSGTPAACTTSFATGVLTVGTNTVTVVATDTAGNQTTQSATIIVDQTNPTVSISGQTTPTAASASQNLTITAADNVALSTVTCRVDSGANTSCIDGTYATDTLTAGSHTITVIATDTAANQTTQTATIVVDQTSPSVAISGLTSPTSSSASQTATIAASDNIAIASQTCRLDSGSAVACTTSFATGALAAGSHTITVVATDTSGNVTTQTATIIVDQTAPSVAITGITSPTASGASQTATITASDNVAIASQTCRLDSGSATACTTSFATGALTAGSHTITVVATDTSGNVTTQTATIIVDQSAPSVAISGLSSPTNSTASQTATIATSDNVALASQTCRLDSGAITACTTSYATGTLTAGSHTITVIATDTSGNSTTQTATIVVDQAAPTVTISGLTSPTRFTTSQTATIAASDNVAIASQTCRLDSGPITGCTTSYSTGVLTAGSHTITVAATDTAGNVATQTATIVVDLTAPALSISGVTSPTASGASQTATITAGDNLALSTVTCRVDSGATTSCIGGSYATGALSAGSHTITAIATDTAGNQTTQTATSIVDQTAPSVAISGLTSPTNSSTSQNATIAASDNIAIATQTCGLDSGANTACTTSFATGALTAGSHTITVIATDTSGNVTTQTATIVVDQTAPSISISGLTSPTRFTTSQTATITRSDNVAIASQTCRLNSGTPLACTTSFATGTLTVGTNTITVVATDTSGNVTTQTATIVVDQTSPSVAITGLTSPTSSGASQTATITASDNIAIATQTCRLDSGANTACTTSYATGALTAGSHSITVIATDTSGNVTTQTATIVVDQTAPSVSISGLTTPTNSTASQTATITRSDNVAIASQTCRLDSGATTPCTTSYATGVLSPGSHTITVVAIDTSGNSTPQTATIVVDQTAPTVAISGLTTPTNSTASQTATITRSDNIAIATQTCRLDSGAATPCTTSYATGTLAEGSHTITVVVTDTAGNTTTQTATIVVDTTLPPAPTVTRVAPTSSPTSSTSAQVTFSANEPGGTLRCSIDGGAFSTCASSPLNFTSLADGPHSVAVEQVDAAGNTGSVASVAWTVDTTPPPAPTVTRTSPNSSPTSSTDAEIAFSANEPGGTLECSVDGGSFTTCASSPVILSGLADGSHTFAVRQIDAAGNPGTASTVSWTVDTAAPSAPSVSSNRTGTVSESTATITYSVSESGGTLECSLDGGVFATCTSSPISLTGLTDGPHTYSVRQRDDAGNVDSAATVAWVVDLTAPNAPTITSPTGSPHYSATGTPIFSGSGEANSTINLYDGATLIGTTTADASGDWTITSDLLSDGSHAITATSTDSAANSSSASAVTSVVVDTATPTVAITAPATGTFINTPAATVSFSVTDANTGSTNCQIDGGAFAPCTSGFSTPALSNGSHTITVQHTDLAGNTGSSSTTFTVDNATPTVAISSPAAFEHVSTAINTINFTVTDHNPSASSSCSVDGNAPVTCSDPFETAALSDGSHTVTVSHTDSAGNTGSAAVTFTVDTQAPGAPTITDAPADPIASNEADFTFTGAESGGAFECSLDGATFAPCSSPANYPGLTDDDHEFRVRQVDEAGNAGAIATHSWTVDTTAPDAPTLNGPSANTNNPESTVSFAGSPDTVELRCSFDGGASATCPTSPLSLGELPDGNYSFTVEAFDAAGNSSTSTIGWTVDTVAPGAPSITAGPVGSVPSPDATFEFTGAESGGIYRCSIDSLPAVNCASPHDATGLADGTYTFHVRQVDAAGNAGPMASRMWTIDTTPPAAPTVTGPSSPSGQTSALIDFSASEPGLTFQCEVDSGGYSPCTDPLSLTGLSDGSHTVNVRAFDAAGNGSAPGTFTWVVDSALFTADISGAPSGAVNSTSASLTLSASLPGSTFECSVDGSAFAACSSPVSLSGLAEGPHSFSVRALNGSQTTPDVTRSWTVDLTNPSVSISSPIASSTTSPDTSIVFTTNDLNAPITTTCKLDSASPAPCSSPHPYSNLSEGNHTVVVTATDAAGNSGTAVVTWHVDNTAPNAPQITQPASNGSTNDTTPTVGGTAEPNSTIKLYDGANLLATITADGSGAWSWTPSTDLSEGTYDFHATATDIYDNESASSATRSLTVDTSPPGQPAITEPSAGPTNDPTPLVKGAAEPGSTVIVYVDGNPVSGAVTVDGSGNWEKLISPALSDGPHTITAVATDAAGNPSAASDDLELAVDTAAPNVSITSPGAAAKINTDSPEVTFTAESGAATRCQIDSGPLTSCASPLSLSGLSEGAHTVTVEASDNAGNVATAVVSFTVDLTDPTAELTGGPAENGESSDDTPTFTFTSNEQGTFECSIDGGAFAPCSSPFTLPSLGEGPHTFTVRAVDEAGNPSGDVTRSWTVDTLAPGAPSIDSPADGATVADSTPTVSGDAGSAEADSTISVYINGVLSGTTTANPDGSWSYTVPTALTDNTYALTATATDAAGNDSALSTAVDVRIDVNDPIAQITGKPGTVSNDSTPTFTFSSNEPGTFECRIDSGAFAPCASPLTTAALADGTHSFYVRALDASGNASPAEQWAWTIDTTPPDVTATPNSPAPGISPTFSFSSTESGTTYRCRIDSSGVFTTCGSPYNAPSLAAGTHTLEIQFTDAAGNTGTKSVNFTVTAPATQPPPATPTPQPTVPTPPVAETCTGSGDEPGIPANMTVLSAAASKNVIKFTTSSDKYILIRVAIYNGSKLVGTAVRANNPGKRVVAIKTKKALAKGKKFTIKLSAITMTGGKSVASTYMLTDKQGKTTLVGADGKVGAPATSAVSCGPEKGAKKVKVKVATKVTVKISDKQLAATAQASDWTIATFRIVQNGNTVARRVFLLKPGKKLRVPLKLLPGKKLVKGNAMIQISTCTVDGVWQQFKKPLNVK